MLEEQGKTANHDHNNYAMQLVTSLLDFAAEPVEFIMLKGEQRLIDLLPKQPGVPVKAITVISAATRELHYPWAPNLFILDHSAMRST